MYTKHGLNLSHLCALFIDAVVIITNNKNIFVNRMIQNIFIHVFFMSACF